MRTHSDGLAPGLGFPSGLRSRGPGLWARTFFTKNMKELTGRKDRLANMYDTAMTFGKADSFYEFTND